LEFAIGRTCECWLCGKAFIMSEKTLQLKPNCGCKIRKVEIESGKSNSKEELLDLLMEKIS
jgi:hypothetical protein